MKKYLVIADYVISQYDGDRHFINCNKLVRLYCVHEEECVFVESSVKGRYYPPLEFYHRRYDGLIELRPNFNGDYSIPQKEIK